MKVLIFLLSIFALIACNPQTETTTTTTTNFAPGSCNIAKWPTLGTGINLKISSEFAGDFPNSSLDANGYNPLEQMAQNWNQAISGIQFFQLPFPTASTTGYANFNNFNDSEMGIYKSHTWYGQAPSSALAVTQYYGFSRTDATLGNYIELQHADIIVNYRDFGNDFTINPNDYSKYDLPTVLLHEMGHFLGMCHDSGHSSVMRPYYAFSARTLTSFDITKITDLYVNNKNTLGSSTSGNLTLPEGTPVNGRVELHSSGKCQHFVNGKLTFEHWVKNISSRSK